MRWPASTSARAWRSASAPAWRSKPWKAPTPCCAARPALVNGTPLTLVKVVAPPQASAVRRAGGRACDTIAVMRETGTTALAVDAGRTLLLDRDEMLARGQRGGDRHRRLSRRRRHGARLALRVVGAGPVRPESLPRGPASRSAPNWSRWWTPIPRAPPKPPPSIGCAAFTDFRELRGKVDAAIVAVPTIRARRGRLRAAGSRHRRAGRKADRARPRARPTAWSRPPHATGRILQVGHLERFNPAVIALERRATLPLFFEIHRLSVFSPRSLDVDVVLDLMIHDLDIVLALAGAEPKEIRAAGISILSPKVDIANVRLQFADGCVANLTASRVSTEKVRKLRLFQPQPVPLARLRPAGPVHPRRQRADRVTREPALVTKSEPLQNQLDAFLESIEAAKFRKLPARARVKH